MLSMTGYGRGEYKEGGIELTAEVKSVNNRYLDVSVKCPRIFIAFEDVIRAEVRSMLTRGHAFLSGFRISAKKSASCTSTKISPRHTSARAGALKNCSPIYPATLR